MLHRFRFPQKSTPYVWHEVQFILFVVKLFGIFIEKLCECSDSYYLIVLQFIYQNMIMKFPNNRFQFLNIPMLIGIRLLHIFAVVVFALVAFVFIFILVTSRRMFDLIVVHILCRTWLWIFWIIDSNCQQFNADWNSIYSIYCFGFFVCGVCCYSFDCHLYLDCIS